MRKKTRKRGELISLTETRLSGEGEPGIYLSRVQEVVGGLEVLTETNIFALVECEEFPKYICTFAAVK